MPFKKGRVAQPYSSGLGAHLTNDDFVLPASNRRQADEAEFVCVIATASGRRIRPMFVGPGPFTMRTRENGYLRKFWANHLLRKRR